MDDDTIKTAQSLRRSEVGYRALVESAVDAIVSADATGRIVSWNTAAERLLGYGADEVLGRPLTILIPEELREAHERGLDRFLSSGEARILGRTVELEAVRADGTTFPIEMALSTWTSDEGRFFTGVIRDII
jgi:PAS domain S-box-containing protein